MLDASILVHHFSRELRPARAHYEVQDGPGRVGATFDLCPREIFM